MPGLPLYRLDYLEALAAEAPEVAASLRKRVAKTLPLQDYDDVLEFYDLVRDLPDKGKAFLACNDRYYLLVELIGREDLKHPWLFDRCREVEKDPYGFIDLWSRGHGKSSIITTGGIIQEIFRDPEVTIAIFSATKPLAQEFLGQIKDEFETNEGLKRIFNDVLYFNPRGRGAAGERPAKWSLARGITVKRNGHPKEATIEAHGLLDGQPTGRHFRKHYYDDIVTQDFLAEGQLKKTAERFELADNLGTRLGVDKAIAGTRYHFADVYGIAMEKGTAIARIHPATFDGKLNGEPVLLTPENWERIKRTQGIKTVNAQMLLNPIAGNEQTFDPTWLRSYEIIPRILNVYVLVDPSKGSGERSDCTAIAVIGIDQAGSKYLLDGVCHRMRLTERIRWVEYYHSFWGSFPGVAALKVGWEQYGLQVDKEVAEDVLKAKDNYFEIIELNTPRQGGHSKQDRIERLEPDIRGGRFHVPCVVHHPEFALRTGEFSGNCYWSVWTDEDAQNVERMKQKSHHVVGQFIYRPMRGLTKLQQQYAELPKRIVKPLKRWNENKEAYDLTRTFIDEMVRHPFAAHDDLIDACSRIYDIDPQLPVQYDAKSTESIDVDDQGIEEGAPDGAYDD